MTAFIIHEVPIIFGIEGQLNMHDARLAVLLSIVSYLLFCDVICTTCVYSKFHYMYVCIR